MTIIRDPLLSPTEASPTSGPKLRQRLLSLFAASALGLTLANVAVTSYLVRLSADAHALRAELRDLNAVEKRIKANLDVLNQGVQARLEDLDHSVRDAVAELKQARAGTEREPARARDDETSSIGSDAPEIASLAMQSAAEDIDVEPMQKVPEPAKTRKPKRTPPSSEVASSYQRIETPDGKVYYKRVK